MAKWLDKYDAPQAQNGIEGTMGGLTDKGFNFNPAWGGAWRDGGDLPKYQTGDTFTPYSRDYLTNFRDEWVKSYNQPIPYALPTDDRFDKFYLEKRAAVPEYYETKSGWVRGLGTGMEEFREGDKNTPPKSMGKPAKGFEWVENYKQGPFKNESQISEYTRLIRSIRNAESRKPVWNRDVKFNFKSGGILQPPMVGADQTVPMYAMGGSIPGSVGFTYARTAGAAPANGPYAKKTKASAQNGKYIKDKVKGIEDELQDRFIKPDLDKAFEKAKKRGINYGAHNGPLDAIRHATSASKVASSIPILGLPIANILGAAHEISANRGDKKELLSDLYNNFIGSVIGSVPFVSDDTRRKWVVDAQKSGILSTIDDTKKEPKKGPEFLFNDNFINVLNEETKKLKERRAKLFDTKIIFEDGGSMKYYQAGLDFKPKTISKNGGWLDKYNEDIPQAQTGFTSSKLLNLLAAEQSERNNRALYNMTSLGARQANPNVQTQPYQTSEKYKKTVASLPRKTQQGPSVQAQDMSREAVRLREEAGAQKRKEEAIQNSALAQSFGALTPGGYNPALGAIGAEFFANTAFAPITGAGRLTQQGLGYNPYGFGESTFGNVLGGLDLVGDIGGIGLIKTLPGSTGISSKIKSTGKYLGDKFGTKTRYGVDPEYGLYTQKGDKMFFNPTPEGSTQNIVNGINVGYLNKLNSREYYDYLTRLFDEPNLIQFKKHLDLSKKGVLRPNPFKNNPDIQRLTFALKQDLANTDISTNQRWIENTDWRTFGDNFRLNMKQQGFEPTSQKSIEQFRKLLLSQKYKEFWENQKPVNYQSIRAGLNNPISLNKEGGEVVKDNEGYWNPENWGKVVEIDSPYITMKGVDQPLIGISDTGDVQYMEPGEDYEFDGEYVTEYPMAKGGVSVNNADAQPIEKLDQLLNFTNYNKPTKGGWLDKYN